MTAPAAGAAYRLDREVERGADPPLDETEAWSLFPEKVKLQELMTQQVGEQVRAFIAQQEQLESDMEGLRPEDEVTTLGLRFDKR